MENRIEWIIQYWLYIQFISIVGVTILLANVARYIVNAITTTTSTSKSTLIDDVSTSSTTSAFRGLNSTKTHQSRLLRKQFGILENDLLLYEQHDEDDHDGAVSNHSDIIPTHETDTDIAVNSCTETTPSTPILTSTDTPSPAHTHTHTAASMTATISTSISTYEIPSNDYTKRSKSKSSSSSLSSYERIREYRRQQVMNAVQTRLEQQQNQRQYSTSCRKEHILYQFWNWFTTQSSLYRQYTFTLNNDQDDDTNHTRSNSDKDDEDELTFVPYFPSSRRNDTISIQLRVINDLNTIVYVYWIDFNGNHIAKGKILPNGGSWHQTTYIDHPWIFKIKKSPMDTTATPDSNQSQNHCSQQEEDQIIILHYIPHQIIPTTTDAPTIDEDDINSTNSGVHRFHIVPSPLPSSSSSATTIKATTMSIYNCLVNDPIFPYPVSYNITTQYKAMEYAIQHCIRMKYNHWAVLQRYINNIINHPNTNQYRHIRIANRIFSETIWNTSAKGILLAFGFLEHYYYIGYVSLVCNDINKPDDSSSNNDVHSNHSHSDNNIDIQQTQQLDAESTISNATIRELQLLLHMIQRAEQQIVAAT